LNEKATLSLTPLSLPAPIESGRPGNHITSLSRLLRLTEVSLAKTHPVSLRAERGNLSSLAYRFPGDFMFQLSQEEFDNLRFHFGTSSYWGGRRYRPLAFTEQGVAMLSSVLRSQRAIQVNIEIMRAFMRLRQMLASHVELARKLNALEKKYDAQFKQVFEAIRQLMAPPEPKRRSIGFRKGSE
jgi:hypothetical protein